MTVVRRCVSLSFELDQALVSLATSRRESVSALVETLLREHKLVRDDIELGRLEMALPDGPWALPGPGSHLREILKEAEAKASTSGAKPPSRSRRKAGLIP